MAQSPRVRRLHGPRGFDRSRSLIRALPCLIAGVLGTSALVAAERPVLTHPASFTAKAPDTFTAKFETSKGAFLVEVHRAWAPAGAVIALLTYGGVFIAGSLAWGMVADGYRPDRYDVIGAIICLFGVAVIMYAPRG